MRRLLTPLLVALVVLTLAGASGCQRMVDVQTGTRVVDSQGEVVSENVRTVRVPMGEAGKYRVVTVTQDSQVASLYEQAQADIAAGKTDDAAKKLAQLLAIQPDYRNAKVQLEAIRARKTVTVDPNASAGGSTGGSTGGSSGGSTGGSTTKPKPKPGEPVPPGLLKWVPELVGYKADKAAADPLSVTRQYLPTSSGKVQMLVVVAEQFRTPADARAALASQVKSRYPGSDSTQDVNGHSTYFGTDARQFAALGFVDGSVMVAAEGLSAEGTPKELKSALIAVVKQLP